MSIINVRLSKEVEQKIKVLRKEGVAVSALVRDAVNQAFARRGKKTVKNHVGILKAIHAQYPAEYHSLGKHYDLADRKQARAAMLEAMRRKGHRTR
jgi:Arc/MetJ-type ribon-helix-helix transcriptional regulator